MIRGTTAQFKFKLPYSKDKLAWATIKFWQPGNNHPNLPITKKLDQCDSTDDNTELCVSLIADETVRFSEKYKARVQLRAQCVDDGTTFGSRAQLFTVYPMHDEIIEEDPTLPAEDNDGWVIFDGETITEW